MILIDKTMSVVVGFIILILYIAAAKKSSGKLKFMLTSMFFNFCYVIIFIIYK